MDEELKGQLDTGLEYQIRNIKSEVEATSPYAPQVADSLYISFLQIITTAESDDSVREMATANFLSHLSVGDVFEVRDIVKDIPVFRIAKYRVSPQTYGYTLVSDTVDQFEVSNGDIPGKLLNSLYIRATGQIGVYETQKYSILKAEVKNIFQLDELQVVLEQELMFAANKPRSKDKEEFMRLVKNFFGHFPISASIQLITDERKRAIIASMTENEKAIVFAHDLIADMKFASIETDFEYVYEFFTTLAIPHLKGQVQGHSIQVTF